MKGNVDKADDTAESLGRGKAREHIRNAHHGREFESGCHVLLQLAHIDLALPDDREDLGEIDVVGHVLDEARRPFTVVAEWRPLAHRREFGLAESELEPRGSVHRYGLTDHPEAPLGNSEQPTDRALLLVLASLHEIAKRARQRDVHLVHLAAALAETRNKISEKILLRDCELADE